MENLTVVQNPAEFKSLHPTAVKPKLAAALQEVAVEGSSSNSKLH